jgi:hypothetical protein
MKGNCRKSPNSVAIASFIFFAVSNNSQAQAATKPDTKWTLQTLSQRRGFYCVTIKYPVFTGSNAPLRRLNSKIRSMARRQYRDAIAEHSSDRSRPNEPLGEFTADYEVEKISRNVASMNCNIIDYTPDAATSSAESQTLNYTLKPLKEFQISDLFKDGVDYQEALRVISMGKLFDITADAAWSLAQRNDDIELFAVSEEGLILFFTQDTPNEIVRVTIPIGQIYNLMDDSFARQVWATHSAIGSDEEQVLKVEDLKKQLAIIAIGTYSKMINEDSSNALAYRERGKWYQSLGRPEVGAKDLEASKRLSPE